MTKRFLSSQTTILIFYIIDLGSSNLILDSPAMAGGWQGKGHFKFKILNSVCVIIFHMNRTKTQKVFAIILILTFLSAIVSFPKNVKIFNQTFSSPEINFNLGNMSFKRDLEIKKGLDLAGGSQIVFQADISNVKKEDKQNAIDAARNVIEKRVNLFGLSESNIQTSKINDKYRIIVELPGLNNPQEAISLIGKTAVLNFRLAVASPSAELQKSLAYQQFGPYQIKTNLSGKDLKKASAVFNQNNGSPEVAIEWNSDGAKNFAEITKKNVGKQLAIFLDDQIVSAPTINTPILDGNAVISGNFKLDEAKQLATQLNAGALPIPIKVIEQKTISATLGQDSVDKSVRAGLIGLFCVMFFMIALYGKLGLIADVSLIIYGLFSLATFKLLPITMTLPGIAGFILSIGMAVDSNILIFERFKEERKKNQNISFAMEAAFGRAWDSIRDANFTTLLVCFILFNPFNWSFLNISGMVRGFALNLAIGVLTSLFTGLVVTRTFIRVFYNKGK
jgi:preprotein translocase subunit SecD